MDKESNYTEVDQGILYKMKLHERITLSRYLDVIRVPGGWIYESWTYESTLYGNKTSSASSVFVPYNKEFQSNVNLPS